MTARPHRRASWHCGLYAKLALTFAVVGCVVTAFVGTAIVIHFATIDRAARLEAQHVAQVIADVFQRNRSAADIQQQIDRLNALRSRDLVVLDTDAIGIADARVDEVGKVFDGDTGGEVRKTLADGIVRTFVERNDAHVDGALQLVVPVRGGDAADGAILGAVIIEYTGIRDELRTAAKSELWVIVEAGGILVLVIMLVGLGIARRVTGPLRALERAVERLASNDYGTRVTIASHDEIGRLGRAFNRMAEDLAIGHAALVAHQEALEQRVAERTSELNEANALLQLEVGQRSWEATHDVLTGLVNRREFERLVEISVASAHTSGKRHVVSYLDLDQFKVINDTCGHRAGDALLKQLAALLQTRIRQSDTLARLGGDEFGVLFDGCPLDRAERIAADLLAAVGDFRFHWEGKVFTVGVSIGLSVVDGETASADILSMADTACYWAKEQGRNRTCTYRAGDSDMATRRQEVGWIARLTQALEDDRFTLYHQHYLPLNTVAGGRLHLEVLLRMIDEHGDLVQPGSFIPAAERYNLMPAIDRWVVRTVFSHYRRLVTERGGAPLTCAINLSGTSINSEGFLAFVREQATQYCLPREAICFEITETVAINNLRHATEFIRECKALGFLFALDDFGTGTSSFGYLKNLPVDYLKIDGGFVRNLESDQIDKAMTETINRIGHIMGIRTVAEYAENAVIIDELRAMGVDYAQGYGVCVPTALLGSHRMCTQPASGIAPAVPRVAAPADLTAAA